MLSRPLVRIAAVVSFLLCVAYLAVAFFMVRGATQAERNPIERTPSSLGLAYDEVSFPSRRGDVALRGWYLRPAGDGPFATIIFVHGLGSNRASDHALDLAAELQRSGFAVLLFDLRAHGESGGERVSAGYHERSDVLGAYDFARSRGSGAVGLVGFSFGAGIALLAAADEPRIAAVVADSAFADAGDLIAQETARKTPIPEWLVPAFLPAARVIAQRLHGIDLDEVAPEEAVRRLAYPVLLAHGDLDERVPLGHGERVFAAAPEGSYLWTVTGAGHVEAYDLARPEYERRVVDYLRKTLLLEISDTIRP